MGSRQGPRHKCRGYESACGGPKGRERPCHYSAGRRPATHFDRNIRAVWLHGCREGGTGSSRRRSTTLFLATPVHTGGDCRTNMEPFVRLKTDFNFARPQRFRKRHIVQYGKHARCFCRKINICDPLVTELDVQQTGAVLIDEHPFVTDG